MAKPSARRSRAKADALSTYNEKRDFSRTAEPAGKAGKGPSAWRFIVQKHDATRLHYDFRLELDGVLKSWAVTRGPSVDPADKRLAVRTEDHPLSYADFEGTIPAGEYGGGTVMLWDMGTWAPVEGKDPARMLAQGHMHFTLNGQRMKGEWILVRMKPRPGEKRENWLLRKVEDDEARDGTDFTGQYLTSVTTGRGMDDIATGKKPPARTRTKPPKTAAARKSPPRATADVPAFRPPQLATLADSAPTGNDWLHEIKYDGYRVQLIVHQGAARAYTRTGLDWTDRFPEAVASARDLAVHSASMDGEMVVLDSDGQSRFQLLQKSLSDRKEGADSPAPIHFFAFDLLERDGEDLTGLPLTERKDRLKALLSGGGDGTHIHFSDHVTGKGERMLSQACELGLEGIVSKKADSRYLGQRTRDWLKVKCTARQEFLIVGWLPSTARARPFSSLLLGIRGEDGALTYAGKVGTGFDTALMRELAQRLHRLERKTPTLDAPRAAVRGAHWVTPQLVAEIAYTEVTGAGVLRHPSFLGLREDKPAKDVSLEKPIELPSAQDGLPRISSRERTLFPEAGVTKGDLADYYAAMAEPILAFSANRFLSLVRCPEGRAKHCFFQRHDPGSFGDAVKSAPDETGSGKREDYLYVEDAAGLLQCVQMGTIEFHGWGSTLAEPDRPDRLVFDLDPDEGLDFGRVVSAAILVRDELKNIGLKSFAMLSGGKGVHVIVPLVPKADWAEARDFSRRFSQALAEALPDRFTAELRKAKRKGRIFIDHLRNQRSSTAVMPWTVRARAHAPVAAPVSWEELRETKSSARFTLADGETLAKRVKELKGWGRADQSLPDA